MASYLSSYFGGSAATTGGGPGTTNQSYSQAQTSSWASTFSSRIQGLRKALTKDNEEDDPDNEDLSHVSNVLRAYYTEKGRPLPEWLPPDPTKPIVPTMMQQQQPLYGQYGNMYQQYGQTSMTHSRAGSGGRAGLSDLWDSGPPQQAQQVQSLRSQRPGPQSYRSSDSDGRQSGTDLPGSQGILGPRILPSQRNVSSQSSIASAQAPATLGSRDRLRARLQSSNSGRASPSSSSSSNVPMTGQESYDQPSRGYGR